MKKLPNKKLPNIRHQSSQQLLDFIQEAGEPIFRLQQIDEWLWLKGATSFDLMKNLSLSLRNKLSQNFSIPSLTIKHKQISSDGTMKVGFQTDDGFLIESVLIPTEKRMTACVSSQVGCSLNCQFCATAKLERKRNLFFDEIWGQVNLINKIISPQQKKITHVVFMGMGEPLLNYKEVLSAIELITSSNSRLVNLVEKKNPHKKIFPNIKKVEGISAKKVTLSTAGITKMISRLGDDKVKFELALSLHATTDKKREKIMMNNPQNNLLQLRKALLHFYRQTGNKITLEYLLLKNFNDSLEDANNLVKFYRQLPVKLVNIIEYNQVEGIPFEKPDVITFEKFINFLEDNKVNVKTRRSRGKDIDAACGQLANSC